MLKSFINRLVSKRCVSWGVLAGMLVLGGCSVLEPQQVAAPEFEPVIEAAQSPVQVEDEVLMPQLREGTAERYSRALEHLREGDLSQAEKLLTKLTKRQPELAGPWVNLGRVFVHKQDDEAARSAFMRALEANPQSCHAHTQLGVLLRRAGEFEAARGHYTSCLAAQPDFGVAHLNLGILNELYLGDLNGALVAYERYLEVTPDAEKRVKGWVADLKRRIDA